MVNIKFGTDGWRAIIAKEFTTDNVARVAHATAKFLLSIKKNPVAVIGHDCRFAGELFVETTAKVLASNGVKVIMHDTFVSTPMISFGVVNLKADIGVVITASHNPPSYSGYKLKSSFGGPLLDKEIAEVEALLPNENPYDLDKICLKSLEEKGLIEWLDLETMYIKNVEANFDLDAIRNSKFEFAFDAMYGSGQNVMRRLFGNYENFTFLHCERDPLFNGIAPEPLHKNLLEFSEMIKIAENIDCGLAVDGDADRIALYDGDGNYVDSHHILLLLIHYLHKYKGKSGKVCTGFSSTVKIGKLCKEYNLPLEIVKIGFKHCSSIMLKENVLVGGEESGGIAVNGYIPERDGIWNGMVIWEAMAKTGKTLKEIVQEIYDITGSFAFERSDLKLDEANKQRIVENCNKGVYTSFGKYKVERVETLDGFKYYLNDSEWVMIRPSGTEPLLRTYAESHTKQEALDILKACYDTIMTK